MCRTYAMFRCLQHVLMCICLACPKHEVWKSSCENHFRTVKTKSYKLVDGECLPYEVSARELCSCPNSSKQQVRCDGKGHFTKCTIFNDFDPIAKRCKVRKQCISWQQPCPAERHQKNGTCGPETGYKQRIIQIAYAMDESTCICKPRVVNSWDTFCSK